MGERTRALLGTTQGIATVHVFSANPKTADGYNAFIFRRDVERSLRKLTWLPEVDVSDNVTPTGFARADETVLYTKEQKRGFVAYLVGQLKPQYGKITNDDFGVFSLQRIFAKEVQRHALATRREYLAALSARVIAERMVHFAAAPNEEMVKRNGIEYFEYGLAKIRIERSHYLVMGEIGIRKGSMPYYDQHVVAKFKADSEAPSLQGHLHIGESAFEQIYDNRFRLILQGVEQYYLQTRDHAAWGWKNASLFLEKWLSDKKTIVLVTGRSSYEKSGAAKFLSPYLADRHVVHLTTVGENARAEDVEEKCRQLPDQIDAYVAVGGGTAIDTTKLLRGFSGVPFLAVPTTAAHTFSYYMTATYGIPHGHAVYMMFPFICKNNGHPEFIKQVSELQSLQDFANERGLDWNGLVDELFAHVNMKRLGNNPVEVRRESFYV